MQTFIYRNKKIAYRREGSGFPVVLLHGFAEDGEVWKYQSVALQEKAMLIIPDLPGSGASERLEKKDDVTMEDYADCMAALLQHEGISQCIVLGHSLGGYITLALVEKYRHFISGFGFVQSTAFADTEEKKAMRLKAISTIGQYGGYAFIKSTAPNLFTDGFKATHGDEIGSLIERGGAIAAETLQQYYKAMMLREDKTSVLQNSAVPVLFIMGDEDKAAPMEDGLRQAHLPNRAYIHILKGVGHMAMWEKKEEVNEALISFIQDIAAANV